MIMTARLGSSERGRRAGAAARARASAGDEECLREIEERHVHMPPASTQSPLPQPFHRSQKPVDASYRTPLFRCAHTHALPHTYTHTDAPPRITQRRSSVVVVGNCVALSARIGTKEGHARVMGIGSRQRCVSFSKAHI